MANAGPSAWKSLAEPVCIHETLLRLFLDACWKCFCSLGFSAIHCKGVRRCCRAAAAILLTPPPPIVPDRRAAAAAAADHMSASRRRRFRGVFTSCRTPAIMLIDFCNAVYNEAWTFTKKNRKNDAGVFYDSPRYSNETWRRQSKVFSETILWK